jgi:glycerol uptake facilitator-like aquaporin
MLAGLALTVVIYMAANISGGHINPVSLQLLQTLMPSAHLQGLLQHCT